MSEPINDKLNYDETDRRLMASLHGVDVPADLQSRLEGSLRNAMRQEQEKDLLASLDAVDTKRVRRTQSPLWNRRNAIAAAVAAGLGGIVFGYRQMTQPHSQTWLVNSTQSLLDQIQRGGWQALSGKQSLVVEQSLQDVGFSRQVNGLSLARFIELQPPRYVERATAYDLGGEVVLLDLVIDRGVQSLSSSLSELTWLRSDGIAFAMASGRRTLVCTGPTKIRRHILRPQTT